MSWRVDKKIQADGTIHVWPERDLIEHELDGIDCACRPFLEEQPSGRVLVCHHSLDGRELSEPDRIVLGFDGSRSDDFMAVCYSHEADEQPGAYCRSACPSKDHESFGACARAANIQIDRASLKTSEGGTA